MRTVLAETTLLLVAASVALVTTTTAGIQVVRHTAANQQHTAGARATTGLVVHVTHGRRQKRIPSPT